MILFFNYFLSLFQEFRRCAELPGEESPKNKMSENNRNIVPTLTKDETPTKIVHKSLKKSFEQQKILEFLQKTEGDDAVVKGDFATRHRSFHRPSSADRRNFKNSLQSHPLRQRSLKLNYFSDGIIPKYDDCDAEERDARLWSNQKDLVKFVSQDEKLHLPMNQDQVSYDNA